MQLEYIAVPGVRKGDSRKRKPDTWPEHIISNKIGKGDFLGHTDSF